MFRFKNTSVLFCFGSIIDEDTGTVHLIGGFIF